MQSKVTLKRWTHCIGLALVTAAMGWTFVPGTPTASAQDVQITGPLAGAPACKHCRVYREMRVMLKPIAGFTLQDEFSRTMMFGLEAGFHFTDWLGASVWGMVAPVHLDTALTDEVKSRGVSTQQNRLSLPSAAGFADQIGEITWMAGVQANFIPLRGKLALFQTLFVDTDFFISGGVAFAGLDERADVNPNGGSVCLTGEPNPTAECLASQSQRSSRMAIAPTFGVGLSLYPSEFFGFTLEWRGVPFSWNTSGTDEGGRDEDGNIGSGEFPDGRINSEDRIFHFNHMFMVGMVFFLPTSAGLTE